MAPKRQGNAALLIWLGINTEGNQSSRRFQTGWMMSVTQSFRQEGGGGRGITSWEPITIRYIQLFNPTYPIPVPTNNVDAWMNRTFRSLFTVIYWICSQQLSTNSNSGTHFARTGHGCAVVDFCRWARPYIVQKSPANQPRVTRMLSFLVTKLVRSKAKTYSLRIAFLSDLGSFMSFSLFWISNVLIATLSSGAAIFYFRGRVWRPLSLTEPPASSAEPSFHFKTFGKAFQRDGGQPMWRDKQSEPWDRLVSLKYFLSYDQFQPHAIESLTLRSSGTFPTTQAAEREKYFDWKTKALALSAKPPWLNYQGPNVCSLVMSVFQSAE